MLGFRRPAWIAGGALWLALAPGLAPAQAPLDCPQPVARIVSVEGTVEIKDAPADAWRPVALEDAVCPGATLHVGPRSRGAVLLVNIDTVLRVDQNTTLLFAAPPKPELSLLDLIKGAIYFLSRRPKSLEIRTPFVNAGVEGTEFFMRVEEEQRRTFITVFEGTVAAALGPAALDDPNRLKLTSGQSAVGQAGAAPRRLDPGAPEDLALWEFLVRPRDAVQWTLYYPPVLFDLADPSEPGRQLPSALRNGLSALRQGDHGAAFQQLDRVSAAERDDRYYIVRAGVLLAVGRVAEARSDLDRALALNPKNGDAYALQTVIAVTQNRQEEALSLGQRAVGESPRSSAAKIALSYAQQANFDLEAARETLLQAVEQNPQDALAWARLAEIWLSLGYRGRSLAAAENAVERAPELSLTNVVLGFARLAQINISGAQDAFRRAMELDSANPMARLGLGLAKIRGSDLAEGREDIEIAVGLAPNNALLRSYLGKAYFEEKLDELAAEQLERAKREDPKDPTPYLYDAIRKQTENRPVEALADIQKSIELNDNRAVYRSRLLLDEDLATRSAALARIYRDLGFEQLALTEGWRSVNTDPGNHSAHRFLADSYSTLPRHEIARVSELLQSQLLQPLNTTPIQPQLAESQSFILQGIGPSDLSFNEFGRAFARDGISVQANGVVGGNDTLGNDLVVAGIADRLSFSVGQFHFETDGFRENNDQNQNIYNAFTQIKLPFSTSLQAELRSKDFKSGDLLLLFDPNNFFTNFRQDEEIDTLRLGVHHEFSPHSDVIANASVQDADAGLAFLGVSEVEVEQDAYTAEIQYLFRAPRFSLIAGGGHVESDRKTVTNDVFFGTSVMKENISHDNLYLYNYINYPENVRLTLGASVDSFSGGIDDRDQLNPKIGITWTPSTETTVRVAAFRTLKRTLISDQTVEPTQISGFNQFFDDGEATDAWRYGMGIDQRILPTLYAGAEFSKRDLEVPGLELAPTPQIIQEDWDEYFGRGYAYWAPHPRWALMSEYHFEKFERDLSFVGPENFTDLTTHRLRLGAGFFHTSGFRAGLAATYVDQEGKFGDGLGGVLAGDDQFWVVDASVGFQFPKRLGRFTFGVRNMFDEGFKFQDTDPENPSILPDRLIFVRLQLAF